MRKRTGPFISIFQLSRQAGVSYKHVRLLVLSGVIPSKQIGVRRLIRTEWAERWLAESDPPNSTAKGTPPPEANGKHDPVVRAGAELK